MEMCCGSLLDGRRNLIKITGSSSAQVDLHSQVEGLPPSYIPSQECLGPNPLLTQRGQWNKIQRIPICQLAGGREILSVWSAIWVYDAMMSSEEHVGHYFGGRRAIG